MEPEYWQLQGPPQLPTLCSSISFIATVSYASNKLQNDMGYSLGPCDATGSELKQDPTVLNCQQQREKPSQRVQVPG